MFGLPASVTGPYPQVSYTALALCRSSVYGQFQKMSVLRFLQSGRRFSSHFCGFAENEPNNSHFLPKDTKKYCTNSHSSCIIYLHLRKCRVRVAFQEKVNKGNGTNKPEPEFFPRKSTRSTHSQEKSVQPQKHCSILQRMRQHPLKGRYITMKVTITGKNIEVSEYLRDLALKKSQSSNVIFPRIPRFLSPWPSKKPSHC